MSDIDGSPVHESPGGLPASRPPRPAAAGHLVGRVTESATRVESHGRDLSSETVLSFRLVDSADPRPRDVQLRGRSILGSVRDGDWVEVGLRERGGRLEVGVLSNLTTGAEVRASGVSSTSRVARVLRVCFVIAFVVVLLAVVWGVLGMLEVVNDGWLFGDGGLFGGVGDPVDPGGFGEPGR